MIERRIKELCIALEALSRIPNSAQYSWDIEKLLKAAITEAKEQLEAKPTESQNTDDDCPF